MVVVVVVVRSVCVLPSEVFVFEHLSQVLDGGADVAANTELLQSQHHIAARHIARVAGREHVTELTVTELVHTALCADRKVTRYVRRRTEIQLLNHA